MHENSQQTKITVFKETIINKTSFIDYCFIGKTQKYERGGASRMLCRGYM